MLYNVFSDTGTVALDVSFEEAKAIVRRYYNTYNQKPILEQKLAIGRFGCRGVAMLLIAFAGLNVQTLYSMKAAKWEGAQGTIGGLRSLCDLTADTVSIIATWKREVTP